MIIEFIKNLFAKKQSSMVCDECHREVSRLRYKKNKWYCNDCYSGSGAIRPSYLHQSAGNPHVPKMTVAKQDVFRRSQVQKDGSVIDTATGREPAY